MYYTIEGKRVLGILYIAGLITGTLFFNITMKMQIFKLSDFLDFTEYTFQTINIIFYWSVFVFAIYCFLSSGLYNINIYWNIAFCYGIKIWLDRYDRRSLLFISTICFLWYDFYYHIYLLVPKCGHWKFLYGYFKGKAWEFANIT